MKDLMTGDFIHERDYTIAASTTSPEHIIATRLERKNMSEKSPEDFRVKISGKIESVTGDMIKIAGHNIQMTSKTKFGFVNAQAF